MASNRTVRGIQKAQEERNMAETNAQVKPVPKKYMLQQAHEIIYGARQQEYGPALENFQNIADLWSVILKTEVTADQVAMCMIQVKVARLIQAPGHFDSWMAIAGYAGCKEKMMNGD
jgi:hypothetical protein